MSLGNLKNRVIVISRSQDGQNFILVVTGSHQSKQGNASTMQEGKLDVRCTQQPQRMGIPILDYKKIINQIEQIQHNEQGQSGQQQHQDQDQDDEEEDDDVQNQNGNDINNQQLIQIYNQFSSNKDQEHRGRGRPKGSKNKKTIIKQAQVPTNIAPLELKLSISGLSKRGKGRPKGSKNKIKDFIHNVKTQQGQPLPFGKRGKGRPKGSKNKIKFGNHQTIEQCDENTLIRKKGRPFGTKNRANSIQSYSGQQQLSQQFVRVDIQRKKQKIYCCEKCQQKMLRKSILQDEASVQQSINILTNIWQDQGPQNKTNLIIAAISIGDDQSLQQFLKIANKTKNHFIAPWNIDKMIQIGRFQTKTKRQYLSKTGKQGNTVLLHDCVRHQQVWWKRIGIERIIASIPKNQQQAQLIINKLIQNDPQIQQALLNNTASAIRIGNIAASQRLLRDCLNKKHFTNFTQQHYNLLIGDINALNHLKKAVLVTSNKGLNFCSAIHAAAVSSNPYFLGKLLQVFTDVACIEDSQGRKAVHYAAMAQDSQNLLALVQNGIQLREYDKKRMTPLMLACLGGAYINVQFILQKVRQPTFINSKSDEGYTALHYAIFSNSIECVQLLLNDPHVDLWALTRDNADLFHLIAGTGSISILELVLKKQVLPYTSQDKFKRTPTMIAIRNHNNDVLVRLIQNGCRLQKCDSSQNSLLHYAAAYGNIEAILILRDKISQQKNKRGLIPWQIAVYKGHLGSARLLETAYEQFSEDPMYFMLGCIRGNQQYMQIIKYINQKMLKDIYYEQPHNGNGYLHQICLLSEDQYCKIRLQESVNSNKYEQFQQQYYWIQQKLIDFYIQAGLDGYKTNYNGQTPLKLCVQNNNLVGIRKLLTKKINFDLDNSSGSTIMHCLALLCCRGSQQIDFVISKLKQCTQSQLKVQIKKIDHQGLDFLFNILNNFTNNGQKIFKRICKKIQKEEKYSKQDVYNLARKQFNIYQQKLTGLLDYLIQLGSDINAIIFKNQNETSKKWYASHLMMKFPTIKVIKLLKNKMRQFNTINMKGQTPLHLYCQLNTIQRFLNIGLYTENDILAIFEQIISVNLINVFDNNKALPIMYAALNCQIKFIKILRNHKSQVNFCTNSNQVPFIQIIKRKNNLNQLQVKQLISLGFDANFTDNNKRTVLHHLAYCAGKTKINPNIYKYLLESGAKINALDKLNRSPLFYCFCKMQEYQVITQPLQKVQILNIFISHTEVNLNLVDSYKRTLLHYACLHNHFFSILILLDRNINLQAKDYEQNTPLALCLKYRNLDQAALLISKGVRYGLVNYKQNKMSYFKYAYENLSAGICFLLLDNGYPIQKALQQIPHSCFKQALIQKYIH